MKDLFTIFLFFCVTTLFTPAQAGSLFTTAINGRHYNLVIIDSSKEKKYASSIEKSFQQDANKHGINKPLRCKNLIDLPVGIADSDHSYGGICRLYEGAISQPIMICNDVLVGHFKMEVIQDDPPTLEQLEKFVADNCVGG